MKNKVFDKAGGKAEMKSVWKLIFFILVCQLAGFVGSLVTTPAISTWYAGLEKPVFSPPNWLFAPVWILLYLLMGISAYLVWSQGVRKQEVKRGLALFFLQLVLNTLWSFLFFGLHFPFLALIEILFLWLMILLTILSFFRICRSAGILLLPYLFWVSFAALLNFSVFVLNR